MDTTFQPQVRVAEDKTKMVMMSTHDLLVDIHAKIDIAIAQLQETTQHVRQAAEKLDGVQ